jgi:hypothetical protein
VRFRNPKLIVDAPQISLPIYTVEDADRVLMGAEMVGLPQSFAYRADGRVTTTIKNTGGKITACSIEPALPPHMYMSLKKNCSPMGYPGGLKMATNYILTASNAGGSSRVEFTLNPDILNPFPVFLGKKYVLRRGVKTLIRPRNFGGTIHECTMGYSSVLPEGLKLDPKNCYIYGIPTKLTGPVSPIPNAEGEWEGRYDINAYGLPFPATPCRGDFSKSPVPNNLPDYCTCRIAQLRDFPANAEKCKDVWPHGDQVNSWNVEMSENGDLRFLKWRSGSLQIEVID